MQRFPRFLLVPLVAAVFGVVSGVSAADYPLFEPFDNTPEAHIAEGWTIVKTGGDAAVRNVPSPTMKSLALTRSRADGPLSADHAFPAMHGFITIGARVMSGDTLGFKTLPAVYGTDGQCAATVGFEGNEIIYYDGESRCEAQPFRPGEWYAVRLVLDTGKGTYDLYVDGIRKARGVKCQATVADVARVAFSVEPGLGKGAHFNDLVVYEQNAYVGQPPAPVFDVTKYGAVADGKTINTAAIQKAVDACAGTNGSVYVPAGIFMSGTIRLKSGMTLFLDPDATLLGSTEDADYPVQEFSATDNIGYGSRKALVFADSARDLRIDGGGTIDGNGYLRRWQMEGGEKTRPVLLSPVRCENMTVQNVYLKDAAVWCFVPVECSNLTIRNIDLDSRAMSNRDGIDPVDCKHVLIEYCTIRTDDDMICPKSGTRSGLEDIHVRHCNLMGCNRASGIKFGTASYGALKNCVFEDLLIKNTDKAAIALESVDGADIANLTFRRIVITDTNSPFYLTIGTRGRTPHNDTTKIGSIDNVLFEDIVAHDLKHDLGCAITGLVVDEKRYPLTNLVFRRCDLTFKGGVNAVPPEPPEMGKQYPECNVWGRLPAYGYFLRHADHVSFIDCQSTVSPLDSRPARFAVDVTDLQD